MQPLGDVIPVSHVITQFIKTSWSNFQEDYNHQTLWEYI